MGASLAGKTVSSLDADKVAQTEMTMADQRVDGKGFEMVDEMGVQMDDVTGKQMDDSLVGCWLCHARTLPLRPPSGTIAPCATSE